MSDLFLASTSSRRASLIAQLGISCRVIQPPDEDEQIPIGSPRVIAKAVRTNALKKAQAVATQMKKGYVIGGDTLVVTKEGQALGKPQSQEQALTMLHQLIGTWHRVFSAVALVNSVTKKDKVRLAIARVWFRDVSDEVLRRYVATGEPLDKAGAYAVQGLGGYFITRVTGSYTAVVGLPLEHLVHLLEEFGFYVWTHWKSMTGKPTCC